MSKKGKPSRRKYVIAVLGAIAVGFAGLIFNKIRRGPSQLQQTTIAYETTKREISQTGEKEVSQSAFTTYRSTREITANDFLPEQINVIDTLVILVNFSNSSDHFTLEKYWDRIFGVENPYTQLNAYYHENFYNQLELRPVQSPEFGSKGYIEIEFEGSPADYQIGWLIGMETEEIAEADPEVLRKVMLDVIAKSVQKHPKINFQNKFIIIVFNARGSEYGRGAIGALPLGGAAPIYDLFIGDIAREDREKYVDTAYFRVVDDRKVVGIIRKTGYTFNDYFQERERVNLARTNF
jgi:hypothetical protein